MTNVMLWVKALFLSIWYIYNVLVTKNVNEYVFAMQSFTIFYVLDELNDL